VKLLNTANVIFRLVNKIMPKAVKKISDSNRPFNQVIYC